MDEKFQEQKDIDQNAANNNNEDIGYSDPEPDNVIQLEGRKDAPEEKMRPERTDAGVQHLTMDEEGDIRAGEGGTAVVAGSSRTLIILGWVSAALTALVSPYFAIVGIIMGVMANRRQRGTGNAVIITNVVLALVNFLLGFFLVNMLGRLVYG